MMIWVPALWVATGVCLFAGIHFLYVTNTRNGPWLYRAFGVLSLLVGVYIGIGAVMESPTAHVAWTQIERLHVAVACLIWPVGTWFIALYSQLKSWRRWLTASCIVFGLCLLVAMLDPRGLLLTNIVSQPPYILPWGEAIDQFTGTTPPLGFVYYAATLATFVWALWRTLALWRTGATDRAAPLLAYLVIQLTATTYSDYLTWHAIPSLNWDALPFVALVILLSRALNRELHDYAEALDASNHALRRENRRRAEAEGALRDVAYRDAVSGLPNRHALLARITDQLAHDPVPRLALTVLDPRRFGVINHALGHGTGDALMRRMAARLSAAAGDGGYVARLSGDEFAVLTALPAAGDAAAAAQQCAEALHQRFVQPIRLDAYTFTPDVAIGVVAFDQTDAADHAEGLLRRAYAALYAAKGAGDDRVVGFTDAMQARTARRLRLEVDLRRAIASDELHLVFQPQVDAAGRLVGAEALVRWQHPTFGLLNPTEFIAIAEGSGQMPALGDWVLRTALAALATWTLPETFRLSINVSPWQIFRDGYTATVHAALAASGVDARRITLEITETAFIHDVAGAAQKLNALAASGLDIAVDDFGTGYAALALLKNFPISELKIDQSFVRDMTLDAPDRLITAMIALGQAMHLRVVAEGVETTAQRDALLRLGCHVLQGFLIDKPLPAAELAARLHTNAGTPAETGPR